MTTKIRQCPRCGVRSRRLTCCGIDLGLRRRWRMTRQMVQHVVVFAKARKGLDEEAYRANLLAVGCERTRSLSREQHAALMDRLGRYPDAPKWRAGSVEQNRSAA